MAAPEPLDLGVLAPARRHPAALALRMDRRGERVKPGRRETTETRCRRWDCCRDASSAPAPSSSAAPTACHTTGRGDFELVAYGRTAEALGQLAETSTSTGRRGYTSRKVSNRTAETRQIPRDHLVQHRRQGPEGKALTMCHNQGPAVSPPQGRRRIGRSDSFVIRCGQGVGKPEHASR